MKIRRDKYQQGSIRRVKRANGFAWEFRYYVSNVLEQPRIPSECVRFAFESQSDVVFDKPTGLGMVSTLHCLSGLAAAAERRGVVPRFS
jgi:hypothetical protein